LHGIKETLSKPSSLNRGSTKHDNSACVLEIILLIELQPSSLSPLTKT
jgi:hypothetical protein